MQGTPKTIIQFWHDLRDVPSDIEECIVTWTRWTKRGFKHHLFDEHSAKAFIATALGARYERAYERCYHPAMQSDYFRLCYLLVEGGCYVDADDVCLGRQIGEFFSDGRLKVQPLCYDSALKAMVQSYKFLPPDACNPDWVFYFNNNPLIVGRGHPIIELALEQATALLDLAVESELPEIQATTGPGNLSKVIFDFAMVSGDVENDLVVLRDWRSVAVSRWPLIHRDDARNRRLSNQRKFQRDDIER